MRYCPTARNFYRIRCILMETLGLPRHAIRPESTFAELIPEQHRQLVRHRFCEANLDILSLSLTGKQALGIVIVTLIALLVAFFVSLNHGCLGVSEALAAFITYLVAAWWITKNWGTQLDTRYKLENAVYAITSYKECKEAGYKLSRKEIFFKVREIVSDNLGVNRDMITEETNFTEDIGAD